MTRSTYSAAIMLSTKYLQKPRLPFAPIFKETVQGATPRWPIRTAGSPVTLAEAGDSLAGTSSSSPVLQANLPPDFITILQDMHNYNHVIDLYTQGLLPGLELAVIADRRNWIQYNLVSLASACEFPEQFFLAHRTYEPCRLASLIYSMLVIFPLPAANRPFKRLASMMKTALLESTSTSMSSFASFDGGADADVLSIAGTVDCWRDARDMLAWCLVLGGMAAKGTSDREWFARQLGEVLKVDMGSMGTSSVSGSSMATRRITWAELKEMLAGVIWLNSVCDMGGHAVWLEAVGSGHGA